MNELQFWNLHVKPPLNFGSRVAWKVGTSTRAGIPDVIYRNVGEVAWLELKRIDLPKRSSTNLMLGLSVEQSAHLRDWAADGKGHAFVLAAIGSVVFLFPWYVPNVIERENLSDVMLFQLPLKQCKTLLGQRLDQHMQQGDPDHVKNGVWAALP